MADSAEKDLGPPGRKLGVGVDFGTTNSVAAIYDGKTFSLVPLEDEVPTLPSAIHLDSDLQVLTGQAAVARYIGENRSRLVQLVPEVIGGIGFLGAEQQGSSTSEVQTESHLLYGPALLDPGLPGRLFRGIKRLLGNSSIYHLQVFGRPFRLVALITPILLRIRKAIQSILAAAPPSIHAGRPVHFAGVDEFSNPLALDRLQEAFAHAGMQDVHFYPEPLAATLSYLVGRSADAGNLLTVDFGGGTLDLSVVSHESGSFRVLATAGLPLGGDHIDQLIFAALLFPELGKGEDWERRVDGEVVRTFFPFEEYETLLLNWAVSYELNQNRFRAPLLARISAGGPGTHKFKRLLELITCNYSYLVFQYIAGVKADLSTCETSLLDIPELDLSIPFSRQQLSTILAPLLSQLAALVRQVVQEAGLEIGEIDIVLGTGGSSLITCVRDLLEGLFPGRLLEHDPFTSVATGLAIASYHGYEFRD